VDPNDIVIGGWDISNMNLADAMDRARVLDIDLQKQLRPLMQDMVPMPGIYDPDFIAANQEARANNLIKGSKKEQMERIIQDIRYCGTPRPVKGEIKLPLNVPGIMFPFFILILWIGVDDLSLLWLQKLQDPEQCGQNCGAVDCQHRAVQ